MLKNFFFQYKCIRCIKNIQIKKNRHFSFSANDSAAVFPHGKQFNNILEKMGFIEVEDSPQNKEFIKAFLLSQEKIVETKISLYRPKTKNGDPRLWVYNLKKNAQPNDLLALVALDSNLVIVNCSQSNLSILLDEKNKKYSKLPKYIL